MGLLQDQDTSRNYGGGRGAKRRRTGGLLGARQAAEGAAEASGAAGAERDRSAASSREQRLYKLVADLNTALDRCAADTGVDEVHRLRTGSRRAQAMVETLLRAAGAAGLAIRKPARSWLRSIKKLRRAAGPVRDLDVHRKMLERAFAQAGPGGEATLHIGTTPAALDSGGGASAPREADLLAAQARVLDGWLAEKRHEGAKSLARKIRKRRGKLAHRQAAFFAAMEHSPALRRKAPRPASLLALQDFVRTTESLPLLDAGNLHEFRKLTKKARYVAESDSHGRPAALAKALKRIQDVIGEWHDWMVLTGEAKAASRQEGPQLIAWLEHNLDRSRIRALRVTSQMRERLLEEWLASGGNPRARKAVAPRRPPSRAASAEDLLRRRSGGSLQAG